MQHMVSFKLLNFEENVFFVFFPFWKIANLYFRASVDWACGGQPGGHIAPRWQIRPNQRIWKIQKYFAFNIHFLGLTLPQYWKRTADNKGIKKQNVPSRLPCLGFFGTTFEKIKCNVFCKLVFYNTCLWHTHSSWHVLQSNNKYFAIE